MNQKPKYSNRLIHEMSPYLLQHAHNPVDWYPWGQEAFDAARDTDKPIFLSIGYATCHWCHVMESESFEDPFVADLLNQTFINIKVDREELPEVDSLYMDFAQSMMAGVAGWPLNVILTPSLQPFFAFTYLPPRAKEGMLGFIDLISRISEVWKSDERVRILAQAEKIVDVFSKNVHTRGEEMPSAKVIEGAIDILYKMADPIYGGLKGSPKFPIPYQCNLFLNYSHLKKDSRALFMAEKTLDMMQRGGIYDHLAGGFSRYSIDEKWRIPHFEKMLYDNALLAHAYLQAWKMTKRNLYKRVCEETIEYLLREMMHPEGGFYSAQDADSKGKEGLFYTWTVDEILKNLNEEDARLFCDFYHVTESGNFEGRNVLHTPKRIHEYANEKNISEEHLTDRLEEIKKQLLSVREKREPPLKDDKVLSSLNGLMLFSLAEAGSAFNFSPYLRLAEKTALFLYERLWKKDKLLRRWRKGEAQFNSGLDDYAFLIRGLISFYEATGKVNWLQWGIQLTDVLTEQFKSDQGGFYQTDGKDESLIIRPCQFGDGAEPSGNAIHCENLLRLYRLSYDRRYLNEAEDILKAAKRYVDSYPPGFSYHVLNLLFYFDKRAPTIVIALNKQKDFYREIQRKIYSKFIPHKAVIWRFSDDETLTELIPFSAGQVPLQEKTTVYICYDRVCEKPLVDYKEILTALDQL